MKIIKKKIKKAVKIKKVEDKNETINVVISKPYKVSLIILGKETNYEGNTLYDIFDLIKPDIVRGNAIIRVYKDNLKSETLLKPLQLKRLLSSNNYKQLLNKKLLLMLK